MLGFSPVSEWWARQGLNLRPHPCEGFSTVQINGNALPVRGTDRDSSANIAALSDHFLTKAGYVYFIRAGRTASVKIGWARDPERRLEGLQTGSPHKLHLIGFAPGNPSDETDWHYRWAAARVRGEWFDLCNDLRNAINDRLSQPDATRFIHIKTDWREVGRAA